MIERVEAVEFVGNARYELYDSHFRTAITMYRNSLVLYTSSMFIH